MSDGLREQLAPRLLLAGAVVLLASLFLTWSHQLPSSFLARFGSSDVLRNIPHDPTAWQVYSAADVVLALLAAGLIAVALLGKRSVRIAATPVVLGALAFVLHALSTTPTNGGANIFDRDLSAPTYVPLSAGAGVGETVALAGLAVALAGLALSLTADWRSGR